jgi:hypothetical protein
LVLLRADIIVATAGRMDKRCHSYGPWATRPCPADSEDALPSAITCSRLSPTLKRPNQYTVLQYVGRYCKSDSHDISFLRLHGLPIRSCPSSASTRMDIACPSAAAQDVYLWIGTEKHKIYYHQGEVALRSNQSLEDYKNLPTRSCFY